ncbi:MAG: hypothetical protein KJO07_01155 [Deltaproteobacteria bacterium]|nr:hypothetical protein [Deltaproteobacteria bacterium]
MGGCTNCKAKSGCDDRKGTMFEALDGAIARLYPERVWGRPDDGERFDAGVCEHDAEALTSELAAELDASTFLRSGRDDEYCDFIYVQCIGREPNLIQIRDGGAPIPEEVRGEAVREQYLRVCLSSMGRFAGVQQVALNLDWDDNEATIVEIPRPGVYDAPLLRRFQKLVAILPAYDIVHLDFGEICAPIEGFDPGAYSSLYGGQPVKANYIFYPQPPTMRETAYLAAPR